MTIQQLLDWQGDPVPLSKLSDRLGCGIYRSAEAPAPAPAGGERRCRGAGGLKAVGAAVVEQASAGCCSLQKRIVSLGWAHERSPAVLRCTGRGRDASETPRPSPVLPVCRQPQVASLFRTRERG